MNVPLPIRAIAGIAVAPFAAFVSANVALAQSKAPTSGPAENGSPAWFLQGSFPDPGGNTSTDANGVVTVLARAGRGPGGPGGARGPQAGGAPQGGRGTPIAAAPV